METTYWKDRVATASLVVGVVDSQLPARASLMLPGKSINN